MFNKGQNFQAKDSNGVIRKYESLGETVATYLDKGEVVSITNLTAINENGNKVVFSVNALRDTNPQAI